MAHNSEAFYKAKNMFNNFFATTEVAAANTAMKIRLRRQRNQLLKNTKPISLDYKMEIEKFWKPFTSIGVKYHQLYFSRNKIEDVRYIPDDLYYTAIDQHFNNRKYGWGVNDKNYYNLYFPGIKQPEIVARKINGLFYDAEYHLISEKDALELCNANEKLIIKPATETGGSRGIVFWNKEQKASELKKLGGGGKTLLFKRLSGSMRHWRSFIPVLLIHYGLCLSS